VINAVVAALTLDLVIRSNSSGYGTNSGVVKSGLRAPRTFLRWDSSSERVVHATARGQGCSTVGAAWRLHRIAALVELRSHTSPSCCADELLCPVRARHRDGEDGDVDREPEHEMDVPERDEQHRRQQSGQDGERRPGGRQP
jgi:hypothetical protein